MYFYQDPHLTTSEIAEQLLGYALVHQSDEGTTAGWIVEVEAYLGAEDQAAHTYQHHRTPRVEAMYQAPGHFYIYQLRGHHLINFVTQPVGIGQGVLIRAIEPFQGLGLMQRRRRGQSGYNLTNGPGKMTQAMGIDRQYYGQSVHGDKLYVDFTQKRIPQQITATPRIGIPNSGAWRDKLLRFIVAGNPYVSHRRGPIDPNHGWTDGSKSPPK